MTFDEEVNVYTQTIQDMKAAFERKDWAYLREHDHYEDDFTEQYMEEMRKCNCVWDIGAGFGFYSLLALDAKVRDIVAVEACRARYSALTKTFGAQISLYLLAAHDKAEMLQLSSPAIGSSSRVTLQEGDPVLGLPLDRVFFSSPQVIKMDIEGAECFALRGIKHTLLVCHPVIFLECHGKMIRALGHTVDSVISFLCSVGYKITAPKVRMVLR